MWKKMNPHTLLVRKQISAATVENSMKILPPELKTELYIIQLYQLWIFNQEKKKRIQKGIWTSMLTAALIPIAKIWKQLSISGWMHKDYVVYTYTVESFSAIKKGNFAICDNMYREIRQTVKDKYCLISLLCRIQKNKASKTKEFIDTENWLVVIRVGGWTKRVKRVNFIMMNSDQKLLWLFCFMHKDQIILLYTRN